MTVKIITATSTVLAHITIKLTDDSVADSTKVNRSPQLIRLDTQDVSSAFAQALHGGRMGETVRFTLEPQDAFGYGNPANLHTVPRERFDASMTLKPGMIIEFTHMNGQSLPGIVRQFDDTAVTVDFNHPLCGQTLAFEVEILAIDPPADYQFNA